MTKSGIDHRALVAAMAALCLSSCIDFFGPPAPTTEIGDAILEHNLSRLQESVKKGQDINQDIYVNSPHLGFTPLMFTASGWNYAFTEYLLSVGANPNLQDYDGNTALDYARRGMQDQLEEMEKPYKDDNFYVISSYDDTESFYQRFGGSDFAKTIALLEPITRARANEPVIITSLSEWAAVGDLNKVRELIAKGQNVNGANRDGWTPLMTAATCWRYHVVQYLLSKGADPNLRNRRGNTALDLVRNSMSPETMKPNLNLIKNVGYADESTAPPRFEGISYSKTIALLQK
jgi:ankyrin repeat protein